jgi:hypothetical protein
MLKFLLLFGMTGHTITTMKAPTDTLKTSISLPGDLARFLEQEMAAEGHQNRSAIIQTALRLAQTLKQQLETPGAPVEQVTAGQVIFTREEIVRLFPSWETDATGGGERGKRSTLNVQHSTLKGDSPRGGTNPGAGPLTPLPSGELRTSNSERPTPKGGDSTSPVSKGKRNAERNEGERVSSSRGGSNAEAGPLTLTHTPTLTPLPSGELRTSNAERPTPKGGDSTGAASKGKRSAKRNEGVRVSARVGVSSPRGGSNAEAGPLTLTRTPALTPFSSAGEPSATTAQNVTPSSPLPAIENRKSQIENPPAP